MHSTAKIYLTVLIGWGLIMCLLPQAIAQRKPSFTNQTTHGLTGAANTVSAVSGLDDKSPMSLALSGTQTVHTFDKNETDLLKSLKLVEPRQFLELVSFVFKNLQNNDAFFVGTLKILTDAIDSTHIRPEGLIYLEAQAHIGSSYPFYSTGALLNNGRLGADIAEESFIGQYAGYSLSFRKDLLCTRQKYTDHAYLENNFIYAAERLYTLLDAHSNDIQNNRKIPENEFLSLYKDFLHRKQLAHDEEDEMYALLKFVDLSRHSHFAIFYNYSSLHDIGELHSVGLSFSQLLTPRDKHSQNDGLFVLLNMQGVFFSPDYTLFGNKQSAVRTGLALLWQNAIPYSYKDIKGTTLLCGRWRWQAGLEYRLQNFIDGHDLLDAFARYRDLSSAVETTFSIGKGSDNNLYLGFSIGKSITF